jgi:hypothetical protein
MWNSCIVGVPHLGLYNEMYDKECLSGRVAVRSEAVQVKHIAYWWA